MISSEITRKSQKLPSRARYVMVVGQFIGTWLFFLAILTSTAFLLNLDWARPQIQQMMSEAFHRNVKLGRLSWSFGLNGLAISTDRMSVTQLDGQPFLMAGQSEIGVAFLPLLQGEMKVKHLSFKKPELWAIRQSQTHWNFSDLLQPGPEIRFIELNDGQLHLRDQATTSAIGEPHSQDMPKLTSFAYDFEKISLKLIFPRKDKRWPFYLSFLLPRQGYTTEVTLSALGNGLLERWQDNKYKFELAAQDLNPADLGPFAHLLPNVGGLFKIDLSGEGTLAQGIRATAQATVSKLKLPFKNMGIIKSAQASSSADLFIDKQKIHWENFVVNASNLELRSQGDLLRWQAAKPEYQAALAGKVTDVSQLPQMIEETIKPAGTASPSNRWFSLIEPGRFSGKAEFDIKLSGPVGQPQISTDIKSDELYARDVLKKLPLSNLGWLEALSGRGQSLPATKLSGQVRLPGGNQIEIPRLQFEIGKSVLTTSGTSSSDGSRLKFDFAGERLDLKELTGRLLAHSQMRKLLADRLLLPSPDWLQLDGRMDLKGSITKYGGNQTLTLDSHLHDATIALKDGKFRSESIKGALSLQNNVLAINQVSGKMGKGSFILNGSVKLTSRPWWDITFHATHIDLAQLDTALKVLKLPLPILCEKQLYGQVRDFSLQIRGYEDRPEIVLTAVPEDLHYQPPGLSRPLRANSGDIRYENDVLTLKDVGLVGNNSRLITSLIIENLTGSSVLRRLKVKTLGAELSEINYYLGSPLMPPILRQGYRDFVKRYHIAGFHGRVYGDVLWQAKGNDFDFDGVVGFYNVGGRFGAGAYPLDHAAGTLAACGSELLLQDITGLVGKTSFALDGHVIDYRKPSALAKVHLKTEVYPDELLKLLPGLADQLQGKIISSGPLSVKATVQGTAGSSEIIFYALAGSHDHLRLVSPFGTLSQPRGDDITLDGSLLVKSGPEGFIELRDSHLIVGDSLLQGQGRYNWFAPEALKQPVVEFTLSSPNPLTARTLVAVLDPATKLDGIAGEIHGTVKAHGEVDALHTSGYIDMHGLALPQYNLSHLTGRIESYDWLLPLTPQMPLPEAKSSSKLKLTLKTVATGELMARNVTAEVFLVPKKNDESPRIALSQGTAEVANGQLKMAGWLDLSKHRVHADCTLLKVDVERVARQLLGSPDEISGLASISLSLDSQGTDYIELLKNLDGSGQITIADGRVTRFGQLQTKLTQANLLQQGLFGFNLNNLLQSVVPVRTGEFKDLQGAFDITDGLLSISSLKYNGNDMRLWGSGLVNLPLNTIKLDIAGRIPRVASSLISGPVGEVSRRMTLQNLMKTITLSKLENLPAVPILGDIASVRPRTFSFTVAAPLDKPGLLARSIEKSFSWLPDYPNASAHPVPGLSIK